MKKALMSVIFASSVASAALAGSSKPSTIPASIPFALSKGSEKVELTIDFSERVLIFVGFSFSLKRSDAEYSKNLRRLLGDARFNPSGPNPDGEDVNVNLSIYKIQESGFRTEVSSGFYQKTIPYTLRQDVEVEKIKTESLEKGRYVFVVATTSSNQAWSQIPVNLVVESEYFGK